MKIKLIASVLMVALMVVFSAGVASAQIDIGGQLQKTGTGIYGGETPSQDLPTIIGNIINVVLGFLGVILVVIIIIGGFYYMTAGGNDDQVAKGKKFIINGIIGLVIILLAYAITGFVVNQLITATGSSATAVPN